MKLTPGGQSQHCDNMKYDKECHWHLEGFPVQLKINTIRFKSDRILIQIEFVVGAYKKMTEEIERFDRQHIFEY